MNLLFTFDVAWSVGFDVGPGWFDPRQAWSEFLLLLAFPAPLNSTKNAKYV